MRKNWDEDASDVHTTWGNDGDERTGEGWKRTKRVLHRESTISYFHL
jgi:hypothetical protein